MEGTYNNPYAQGQSQSPLSPQTPGGNGYQVNVNRQKTRKWVQAPVQNYDGDDWGADEFDDDEPPPPPPVPRVTTGLRPIGQRLPSESYGPSPRLAAAVASSSRSSSGPPSLHLQTQHPAVSSSTARPEQVHNVSSPVTGRDGSPAPSGAGSSKAPSYHQHPDVRSSTPQSTSSSAARASPSIRPSELYRHVDDERKLGGSPLSIAEAVAPKPGDRSTPPINEPNRQGHGQSDGPAVNKVQKQPTFDSILAKRDSLDVGQQGFNDAPVHNSDVASQEAKDHKEEPVIHSPADIDRKRLSVSPQLPDVARMSVFGADFFSSGNNPNAPPSVQDPVKQEQPSAARQSNDSPGNLSTLDEDSRDSQDNTSIPGPDNASAHSQSLAPANDPRSVPPLRTPSPNAKGLFAAPIEPPAISASTIYNVTPTEPLQPRQPEYSPSEYEPASARTQGTMNTFNTSPVKESDMLSEEIMRSLSPIAPTPNSTLSPRPPPENTQSLSPGGQNDVRNSSYTLSDYDSYWADSTDKPGQESSKEAEAQSKPMTEVAPVPEPQQQSAEQPPSGALTSSETQPAPQPESPNHELRRRFSWEAGFDSPPKIPQIEPPAGTSNDEAPVPTSPSPLAASDVQSPKDVASDTVNPTRESPRNVEPPRIVIPASGGISHQVSKASTLPPSQQPATLEPPSPVSVENDDATPQATGDRRPSLADKTLAQTPSNLTSATPPPEKSTRAAPSSEIPQTTPWRDIMSLATPVQRTLKFEAGLDTHRTWESGLENWLSNLMTEHPEYANGTSSFSGAVVPSSQKGHASGPSVSHNQQPYYQQYLNASSPTTGPAASRSRLGPLSAPSGTSGFGNSSNQIGTKSKELMQSAGKMGKGLFSKGKSKLRGTGDKGEPTSPVQTKPKTERRASWGLDRLTRSRADSYSEKDVVNSRPSTQSYHAPQSSQSSSILPFGPMPSTGESGKRIASHESYGPQLSQVPSAFASKEHDDRSQWHIPTPVDEATWDPFKDTDLAKAKENASEHSGALVTNQNQLQPGSGAEASSSNPFSGNATPTPANNGIRMVPSEEPAGSSHQPTYVYTAVASQNTPASVQPPPQSPNQPHDYSAVPQRHSSFVGLPLIRRGSTFDVNSKSAEPRTTEPRATEPIDERVSIDADDDDAFVRQQGTLTSEVTVESTLVGTDSLVPGKEFEKDVDEPEQPAAPVDQQVPAQQRQPPQAQQQLPQHPFQMHPVQQGTALPQNPAYGLQSQPRMPPNMMGGNPVQRLPPSGPWKLEESHLSEPLHRVTPKTQQLPPSGQWKLEESHLAEPLHVVNRRRAGTGGSQQDPFFGYNKETGDVPPSPSSSSTTQQYHQRQKPSEVPPSSANRYPGLFPSQQRRQSNPKEGQPGPGSQFIRRLSQEGAPSRTGTGGNEPIHDDRRPAISRTGTGGNESIHDDRGRPRKASALFKDIGHRFRKSSTERQGTPEPQPQQSQQQQQQPQLVEPAYDAASVSSVTTDGTTDKKKHRASFMLGLRNRGLADQRQKSQERLSMPPPPRPDEARPDSSMENKRGSRFYPALGPVPGQQRPVGPSRASTSNLVNELSQSGSATPPAKKRFSAFNTRAAVSGVFNRPSSGTSSKPGTPTSTRPLSSHLDAQQPVALERPHPGFERSNTAGPTFNQILPIPTGAPAADAPERRKRRGSAAGLISGLLGHVQKNKESQQSQQSAPLQAQQPPMQQPQARHSSGPQLGSPQPPALQTQGRRSSGPQLPTPVLPGPQLGSPKLPGASFESPKLQNAQLSGPQTTGPPLASPQPQRPQQFGNQQPPMLRQTTGGALPAEQPPTSSDRPSSGGVRDRQAQAAYRNSRPSPLGFGSTTPAGTPPIGSMNEHSRHGTPQTPFSVGQTFSDARSGRMRSISPAASAIRTAPTTQTSFNNQSTAPTTQTSFLQSSRHQSSQSLDKLAQSKYEGSQIQRPVTDSPNMSFRHDARHGQASDSGMPLSPVSQMSKTGPSSVSSVATQSPRLNTSFAASGRRQSSQLSQPDTPVISAVSSTPPMQNQAFANRVGVSPQQQSFPPGVQQQPTGPRQTGPQQGGYQIAPGQQSQPNFRTPSGSQFAGPYPQAGMAPGRPPMQMQHSSAGPPVPPKDGANPLQQPQFANAPVRQGSPGASKWKGLKNRMSGQGAHKSAPSQGKSEGDKEKDKLTASKILGAFKRTSKANRESQVIPDLQAYQQHQMQRQQQQPPQPGQQQPQQFAGQAPYGQTQSPRPSSQFGGQPFGQLPTPRPSSQFSNQSMGQLQAKRHSSMFGSPNMAPQQLQRASGSFPQGVPGMPQPGIGQPQPNYAYQSPPQAQGQFLPPHSPQAQFQSPPQQQGQFQSPVQQQGQFSSPMQQKGQFQPPPQQQGQFQSPPLQQGQGQFQSPVQQQGQFSSPVQQKGQFQSPLPQSPWQHQTQSPGGQFSPAPFQQAYRPGQGQGMVSQSPNTPSHRSPSQSQFPQQSHSPAQQSPLHREESPVHISTPTSIHHPTPVHAPSPRPSLLNLQAMIASEDNEANQEGQRESTQAAPRNDHNNASHRGSPSMQRFASDSPHSGRNSGSPRVGANPSPAQYVSPRASKHYENGAPKTQAPVISSPGAAPGSVVEGHAVTSASEKFSPKVEDSQGVSLSPPAVVSDNVSPASVRHSPSGMSDLAAPEIKPRAGPAFHAELEDTEDARKRTLRINSQEEKIHYDPNADSDGEPPPQMSATSYPGQEWNPYGMPELGDWNEGLER
ncbi:hypothetical protein NW762_007512 [Fusarium torreyae]|uniref:SWI-SNF chromatin-remodeling complex protein n=1 Tax=Fusarium torreyae TaxID=1237075 RepID=A0A9W8S0Y7_9HYPO|nr:hypothetical protein NW762_007512 [Fusarium torreyae]